jgi:uncharacterized protein
MMDAKIISQLTALATATGIKILYACESGSRAWGFPSADSDYDVRFIYLRPRSWYLSIEERRDTIELPIDDLLDINGWDLRKVLRLFYTSNAAVYEWIQSPIVYHSNENLPSTLLDLANEYYAPRAGVHHYLSMARNCEEEYLRSPEVKLKKYFYALRPLLAAIWIVDNQTVPPMTFDRLLELMRDRPEIVTEIDRLLKIKSTADESTMVPAVPLLNEFIIAGITECELAVKSIPKVDRDTGKLNRLFQQYVMEYD